MNDQQNNEDPRAFTKKDLEGFLIRLGITVNSETIRLASEIDAAMRGGRRAAAKAAVQQLIALFREATPPPQDGRVEENVNALDRGQPNAALVDQVLDYYENLQITLQAVDPEESPGEIYSDEMLTRMVGSAGLPNEPLIKSRLKDIGTAYVAGGDEAAEAAAQVLIAHLAADGHIEGGAEARQELLDTIINTVARAEASHDALGDPDGNEDLYDEKTDAAGSRSDDVEIDVSGKEELDRRKAEEEARRASEASERTLAELELRQLQLFEDMINRDDGLIDQIGFNLENSEDAALLDRLKTEMLRYVYLVTLSGPEAAREAVSISANFEQIAAQLAARTAGDRYDEATLAAAITRDITEETRDVTRQVAEQLSAIHAEIQQDVEKQMRQEALAAAASDAAPGAAQGGPDRGEGDTDPDEAPDRPDPAPIETAADDNPDPAKTTDQEVQKVAAAMRAGGMREAQRVAMEIAGVPSDEGNLRVPEEVMVEDLLAHAEVFIAAQDEYTRKVKAADDKAADDKAKREQQAAQDNTGKATGSDKDAQQDRSGDDSGAGGTATDPRTPRLSDYQDKLLEISFLRAVGTREEVDAATATLAATLRALGGEFADIDEAEILRHVSRLDKEAKDARKAAASAPAPEQDEAERKVDDETGRGVRFLFRALGRDRESTKIFKDLVGAMLRRDKNAAGTLVKALASHISNLYDKKVTPEDLRSAIVSAAGKQAQAEQDANVEQDGKVEPVDAPINRPLAYLSRAIKEDARSAKIFNGLVVALTKGDKSAAGQLVAALEGHIATLYELDVTTAEMRTGILNAAKQEAKARQEAKPKPYYQDKMDKISELRSDSGYSSDSGDSSPGDGPGGDNDDDDSDLGGRAGWFLLTALRTDARTGKIYEAVVRAVMKGDKVAKHKLAKALATHILQLYKTNVTVQQMLDAIINKAKDDAKADQDDAPETPTDRGNKDNDDNDDQGGAAGAVAADGKKGASDSESKYDLGTIKKVDWQGFMGVYRMDAEESEAAADVAKLIVKKGKESPSTLKSAKDLLTRSSKKVKGTKVKNHKHFVAAIEDAMIKKTESKKVVKPLKFADIPEDMRDDVSV